MIKRDKLGLYETHIDDLQRINNSKLYYSLYSIWNMLNLHNNDRAIITRETNNISYNICNALYGRNISASDYVYYTKNSDIRLFGGYMHVHDLDENVDVYKGDDIWVSPVVLLMILPHIKADSIDSHNAFTDIVIRHSCLDLDSYTKFVSVYDKCVNKYYCDQAYSDMLCANNRLFIHLSFYCKPDTISIIYRKLDKYIMGRTMSLTKRNCGIPKYEDPFVHMSLEILQIYTDTYNRLYKRIKGLARSNTISKEVDNMVNAINNNELSMNNTSTFKFSK